LIVPKTISIFDLSGGVGVGRGDLKVPVTGCEEAASEYSTPAGIATGDAFCSLTPVALGALE